MYIYTFHSDFIDFSNFKYLDRDYILYVCRHSGKDKNNLKIETHYHVITKQNLLCKYDNIFTYKQYVDVIDICKFVSYCEDGHCDYDVIIKTEFLNSLLKSVLKYNYSIDDLLKEIVYNSENQIIKSHSYYLKKYGKVYLFNFKKIREMFDYSSAFYDWTDTSSFPNGVN